MIVVDVNVVAYYFTDGEKTALAIEHPVSAYDGQYIALAQRRGASFVTEDQRLLKTFPALARTMQAFIASHPDAR